jgi:single-stranded-DNA-specific exonuclease
MKPITEWDWLVRGALPELSRIEGLAGEIGVSTLAARVLLMRGYGKADIARGFLHDRLSALPDPEQLIGMEKAAERLVRAVRNREAVLIHGDYDVDGITAAALLVEFLRSLGGVADFHIPLRLRDGYGLSGDALRQAHERGYALVVSVDCGISAHEPARLAKSLGLDLIITDHHQPPPELPEALALVNPHLPGDRFPDKNLAGVGVAFLLAVAVRRRLRRENYFAHEGEPDVRFLLDLVALGTIADIAPLTGVNRQLVRSGLVLLNQSRRPGIAALRKVAGSREVTCAAVGFQLAPRLNAAGRLEDAALGVELLLCSDPARAQEIALELDNCNRERQTIEQQTLDQALEQLEKTPTPDGHTIILADERWHSGVIGIVASRLVERYHRPTVMIALDQGQGKGSGRSIRGFDLYAALCSCAAHLEGFGGHPFAAGLTIAESNLQRFRDDFEAQARKVLGEEDLRPRLLHDGDLDLSTLALDEVRDLSRLAPFGPGNPEPLFCVRAAQFENPRSVGRDHLQFHLRHNSRRLPCIAFGKAQHWYDMGGQVDALCTPQINQWQGRETLQLRVRDLKRRE